jgi:hypothetical protein
VGERGSERGEESWAEGKRGGSAVTDTMSGIHGAGEADSGTNTVLFECGKKEIFTPTQGFKVFSIACLANALPPVHTNPAINPARAGVILLCLLNARLLPEFGPGRVSESLSGTSLFSICFQTKDCDANSFRLVGVGHVLTLLLVCVPCSRSTASSRARAGSQQRMCDATPHTPLLDLRERRRGWVCAFRVC